MQADFAPFGVTVVYETRPGNVAPYTMEMMGGDWSDTNIGSPAGGVAPGADCGALGQRHVVYAFSSLPRCRWPTPPARRPATPTASITFDCNSVMSYCAGGDGSFRDGCAGLCESQCQGPNSAGCQLTHEMFCGEGSVEQNDFEEMSWIFGGNEPDMEAPSDEITSPCSTALESTSRADVDFRAVVDDNYGGYGWKSCSARTARYDQVDYDREVDDMYRAAVNLQALEPGTYELGIEVHDQFGHVSSDAVTIQVGGGSATSGVADGTGGSGSASGDGGTADGGSADGGDTDGGSDGTGPAAAPRGPPVGDDGGPNDRGCACTAGPGAGGPGSTAAWLGLVVLAHRPVARSAQPGLSAGGGGRRAAVAVRLTSRASDPYASHSRPAAPLSAPVPARPTRSSLGRSRRIKGHVELRSSRRPYRRQVPHRARRRRARGEASAGDVGSTIEFVDVLWDAVPRPAWVRPRSPVPRSPV
ncbi:MAG: hypothetical protein U0168_28765 [Nannocystaceae bacterium]